MPAKRRADHDDGHDESGAALGVRERNRVKLRRRLSDTATAMFLEHGFDEVRVSDVAKACGVSTKTVWNHFPTKESLLLDRGDRLAQALADPPRDADLLDVVLACITTEIDHLHVAEPSAPDAAPDAPRHTDPVSSVQAFVRLVEAHPGLQEAAAGRLEALIRQAANALATQSGTPASSPRNQILAGALISLWRLHLSALLDAAERSVPPPDLRAYVHRQVHEGADIVRLMLGDGV